ncbi:YcgN family cysteine cluster protein [Defluviicoccus vanus]|uniref:UPF0260 protein HQ394_08195 n=1 Tax=Defluviicoccus vanus TaxID=111831 RepID=A0A7H1N0R7_9PROT|nr:YcgN family cysteine cluster protein [Defluviicoccus vanus]QNT69303.1 YcgN family cysteine cluster protein [Defluviicoccus vanus]
MTSSPDPKRPFWEDTPLAELTAAQWESLCDGCGKCCLEKLEDGCTGEISFTNVACGLLDLKSCRCRRYTQRHRWVPNCQQLTVALINEVTWLPSTCAYRLRAEGQPLPHWHHLVSGDREMVHRLGFSVRGRVVSEHEAGPLEHHIVEWPA